MGTFCSLKFLGLERYGTKEECASILAQDVDGSHNGPLNLYNLTSSKEELFNFE